MKLATTMTILASSRICVPEDLSVAERDDDKEDQIWLKKFGSRRRYVSHHICTRSQPRLLKGRAGAVNKTGKATAKRHGRPIFFIKILLTGVAWSC